MKVKNILILIAIIVVAYIFIPPIICENTELRSGIGNGLSEILLNQNNYDLTMSTTDWVLEKDPCNVGALEQKVEALSGLEQYEDAAEIKTYLVAEKGVNATKIDWNSLAELNAKAGNIEGCVDAYEQVVAMSDPTSMDIQAMETGAVQHAFCEKGSVLIKLQRYDEAIACYNSVIDMNPSNTNAWIGIGDAYLFKSMYDQGRLKDMYKELGKTPAERDKSVQRMDIPSYSSHRKALEAYQQAVEIDPLIYPLVATKILGSYEDTVNSYQEILEGM